MGLKVEGDSAYIFVAPVVPGKEEAWRRFLQEVAESRVEYGWLRGHLRVRRELVWLVPLARGYASVAYLEIDGDLDEFVGRLSATEGAFALWLREGIVGCHGRIESANLSPGPTGDAIFSSDTEGGDPRGEDSGRGPLRGGASRGKSD